MRRFTQKSIFILAFLVTITGCKLSNETVTVTETETESIVASTEYHELSVEEKVEDFEFLFATLSSNYPYFEMNKRLYSVDWLGNKDSYLKRIEETEGDLKFTLVLNSIMDDLNYGHAQVLSDRVYAYLLSVYKSVIAEPWVEVLEAPVVQSRYSNALKLLDNGNETEEYANPDNIVLEKWEDTSTAYIKIKSFKHMNIESDWEVLQPFLNDLDEVKSLIIDIRGNTGGDSAYWSDYLVPELLNEPKESSQYYCFRGGEYSEHFIEYRFGCNYTEMEVVDQDFYDALSSNTPPEIKTDFAYYMENTTMIEPVDEGGFRGDIYLLVDHKVISSAEQFVQFVRATKLAYIVGEPTSGESAGFDSLLLSLPNSGYVIRFPGVMVLDSSGINTNEVMVNPDYLVESKLALEKAIELIKDRNE